LLLVTFRLSFNLEKAALMPALPWLAVGTPDPDADLIVMASRLPLRSHGDIPRFLRHTWRIRRQLARSPGLIGYSLDAHLLA
jgi:hypothetical protein